MPSPQQQLIDTLHSDRAKQDPNTVTLANLVTSLITDTLSGDKYLGELLQNADDSKSPSVEFKLNGNYLIFKHKGRAFNDDDVKALCNAASPDRDKVHDIDQIGNKGIGFKAVFSMSDCVMVFSNGYQYRFQQDYPGWQGKGHEYPWQIIPIWTELDELDSFDPTLKSQIAHNEVVFIFRLKPDLLEDITKNLKSITTRHLLFLRNVKAFTFTDDKEHRFTLQPAEVIITENDYEISKVVVATNAHWYIYRGSCPLDSELKQKITKSNDLPEKYRQVPSMNIHLAVFVRDNNCVAITSGQRVFCYLATNLDLGMKMLCNGEFLLDSSRMQFREGAVAMAWNGFMLNNIFRHQLTFLNYLARKINLWASIFHVFSPPTQVLGKFQAPCTQAFESKLSNVPLVLNIPKKKLLKIASTLIDDHGFVELFGDETDKNDTADKTIQKLDVLRPYKAQTFDLNRILSTIQSKEFCETIKSPEQNRKFFEWLEKYYLSCISSQQEKIKTVLYQRPLFLSAQNKLMKINEVYFPDDTLKYILTKFDFIQILHPNVNASPAAAWLAKMNLNKVALNHIVDLVNKSPADGVRFFCYLAANPTQLDQATLDQLKRLKVKNQENSYIKMDEAYLPSAATPNFPLENYAKPSHLLVNDEYFTQSSACKEMLLKLGCQQSLTLDNLPRIIEHVSKTASADGLIQFTRAMMTQFYVGKSTESQQKCLQAAKALKVVNVRDEIISPIDCYLADCYAPKQAIQSDAPNLAYLTPQYLQPGDAVSDWHKLFTEIGVHESISLQVHQDPYRENLQTLDPIAKSYFEELEKRDPNLYPYATKSYMSQHHLAGPYIQINYINHLLSTPVFWKILIRHASKLEGNMHTCKYITYYSRNDVPSNLRIYVDQALKCATRNDTTASEYYGYHLREQLGSYVDHLNIADVTQGVSATLSKNLGFQFLLSIQDCIDILNKIAHANNGSDDFPKIIIIYRHLIEHANLENFDNSHLKLLSLLNQKGEFVPAAQLHSLDKDCLSHMTNSCIIRKPESISEEDFKILCDLFGIQKIEKNQFHLTEVESNPSNLTTYLDGRLLILLHLEANKHDWTGTLLEEELPKLYLKIQEKFSHLTLHSAKNFIIKYEDKIKEELDLWIDEERKVIYHCSMDELDHQDTQTLYEFLYQYLDLNIEQAEFLAVMTCPYEKLDRRYSQYLSSNTLETLRAQAIELLKVQQAESANDAREIDEQLDSSHEQTETAGLPQQSQRYSPSFVSQFFSKYSSSTNSSFLSGSKRSIDVDAISDQPAKRRTISSTQSTLNFLTRSQREALGRRGEELVYDYLLTKHREKHGDDSITEGEEGYTIQKENFRKEVKWLNKNQESYEPYDFVITVYRNDTKKERHIEVKATMTDQDKIEINYSTHEWELLNRDNQSETTSNRLFVVRNINSESPSIEKLNLYERVQGGQAHIVDYKRVTLQ